MNKLILIFSIVISFSANAFTGTISTEYWNCTKPSWISNIKSIKFEPLKNDFKNVLLNTCEIGEDCEGRKYYEWQIFKKINASTNSEPVYINEDYKITINSTNKMLLTITLLKSPETICIVNL